VSRSIQTYRRPGLRPPECKTAHHHPGAWQKGEKLLLTFLRVPHFQDEQVSPTEMCQATGGTHWVDLNNKQLSTK